MSVIYKYIGIAILAVSFLFVSGYSIRKGGYKKCQAETIKQLEQIKAEHASAVKALQKELDASGERLARKENNVNATVSQARKEASASSSASNECFNVERMPDIANNIDAIRDAESRSSD